jgi:enoyl-[acyl-carrier protein] reductase I
MLRADDEEAGLECKQRYPVGKEATFHQWVATVDKAKFEMDVAPWGEGHLRANGLEIGFRR